MASALHSTRLDAVTHELLSARARQVIDLGCGRGELLLQLRDHAQFTRLLGIDIDQRVLVQARAALGLDLLHPDPRLHVFHGSFEEPDWELPRVDAAVLLETIEHVDPGRLPRVEHTVFGRLRPGLVLITTPNSEYNVLHGMAPDERRHPGHRFEWNRARFRSWCEDVACRRGYQVRYIDVGEADPVYGSPTQMARFARTETPPPAPDGPGGRPTP